MNKRMILLLSVLVMLLAAAVFLFFKAFFDHQISNYATEILSAFLGTILTIIITAILLSAQSAAEEKKEKSLGIFQAKLNLYLEFVTFLNKILRDDKVDGAELRDIRDWVTKIALVSGSTASDTIAGFIKQLARYKKFKFDELSDQEKKDYIAWQKKEYPDEYRGTPDADIASEFITIGLVIAALKEDLGEIEVSSINSMASAINAIDAIL